MKIRRPSNSQFFAALFLVAGLLICLALAVGAAVANRVPVAPPQLVACAPQEDGDRLPTTPISLTFDQPVNRASLEAAFSIEPPLPGSFRWNRDQSQVAFVPAGGYALSTTITVRLAPGVQGTFLPLRTKDPAWWSFSLPPLVASLAPPAAGEQGPRQTLTATFNYTLDCDAARRAFTLQPHTIGRLACDGRTLTFDPGLDLAPDTLYIAGLDSVPLRDTDWTGPATHWQFRTAAPLTVLDVRPTQGDDIEDLWTPIRVTFNRPPALSSVVPAGAAPAPGDPMIVTGDDGAPLAGQFTWQGPSLIFRPDQPLAPDTTYRLALGPTIHDLLGWTLGQAITGTFHTRPMLDAAAIVPAEGADQVPLGEPIRIPFARPMDRAAVQAAVSFSPPAAGGCAWEGNTCIYHLRQSLLPATHYTATLAATARDESGAPLARDLSWSFDTAPLVTSANLPRSKPLTSMRAPLTFSFALPMDRASVEAALFVSPTVDTRFEWADEDMTLVVYAEPFWRPGTRYQISLPAAVRPRGGPSMGGPDYHWTLDTAAPWVHVGFGPGVQAIDPTGDRAFQFMARGADAATWDAYVITPTQFMDGGPSDYSDDFGGAEATSIDTAGLPPAATWTEIVTPVLEHDEPGVIVSEAHVPSGLAPGFYLLAPRGDRDTKSQLLIILTHYALLAKASADGPNLRVDVWDVDLEDGRPVANAAVYLYGRSREPLAGARTNKDGLARLSVPADSYPGLVMAEQGGEWTACGLNVGWSTPDEYPDWASTFLPAAPKQHVIYARSDRAIYQPGRPVYYRGVVRAVDDDRYSLPDLDRPATVSLQDPSGGVAASTTVTLTRFGTFSGALALPPDAEVGGFWTLEIVFADVAVRQSFMVYYPESQYRVTVTTPRDVYSQDEPITATVQVSYQDGRPAAGVPIVLDIYRDGAVDAYEVTLFGWEPQGPQKKGQADAQGRWTATMTPADLEWLFPNDYQIRDLDAALAATVGDEQERRGMGVRTVTVKPTSATLYIHHPDSVVVPPGRPITVTAHMVLAGRPVANVPLTATLTLAGPSQQHVAGFALATGPSGTVTFTLPISRMTPGEEYELAVVGRDPAGHRRATSRYYRIGYPDEPPPWPAPQIAVSPDRERYAPGDPARLTVTATTPGPALLTVERGGVRGLRVIELITGTNILTVPVQADYAPNVFATVSQFGPPRGRYPGYTWRESELREDSARLLVPFPGSLLSVTITGTQAALAAGAPVTFAVQVRDDQGRPVAAEVSVAIVDEASYRLAQMAEFEMYCQDDPAEGGRLYDIDSFFHDPRPSNVATFDSLHPIRGLGPPNFYTCHMWWMWAEDVGPMFPETALWSSVVTGEDGRATIDVRLPGQAGRWWIVAWAVTPDTGVGQIVFPLDLK